MTAEMAQTRAGAPESPASVLRRAARMVRERAEAATDGPWRSDEDARCWRLHGVAFRIPAQGDLIPEQVMSKQILKAPKSGTPYAEYWPEVADSAWITSMSPLVGLPLADWLDATAVQVTEYVRLDTPECAHEDCSCERVPAWGCDWCGCWLDGGGCTCWDAALNVARACLGETAEAEAGA